MPRFHLLSGRVFNFYGGMVLVQRVLRWDDVLIFFMYKEINNQ